MFPGFFCLFKLPEAQTAPCLRRTTDIPSLRANLQTELRRHKHNRKRCIPIFSFSIRHFFSFLCFYKILKAFHHVILEIRTIIQISERLIRTMRGSGTLNLRYEKRIAFQRKFVQNPTAKYCQIILRKGKPSSSKYSTFFHLSTLRLD